MKSTRQNQSLCMWTKAKANEFSPQASVGAAEAHDCIAYSKPMCNDPVTIERACQNSFDNFQWILDKSFAHRELEASVGSRCASYLKVPANKSVSQFAVGKKGGDDLSCQKCDGRIFISSARKLSMDEIN
jgi:hypothetical protein